MISETDDKQRTGDKQNIADNQTVLPSNVGQFRTYAILSSVARSRNKSQVSFIQDLVRHSHLQVTNGFVRSVCAIAKCTVYESVSDTTDPFERELAQGFRKSRWGRLLKDLFVRITFSYCQVGWSITSVLSSPRENYWKQGVCLRDQANQKLL